MKTRIKNTQFFNKTIKSLNIKDFYLSCQHFCWTFHKYNSYFFIYLFMSVKLNNYYFFFLLNLVFFIKVCKNKYIKCCIFFLNITEFIYLYLFLSYSNLRFQTTSHFANFQKSLFQFFIGNAGIQEVVAKHKSVSVQTF